MWLIILVILFLKKIREKSLVEVIIKKIRVISVVC